MSKLGGRLICMCFRTFNYYVIGEIEMNKKLMSLAIAGSLAVSLSAFASTGPSYSSNGYNGDWSTGWYIGAGINGDSANTHKKGSIVSYPFTSTDIPAAAGDRFKMNNSDIGFDAYVGRQVSDHFAAEFGYTYVGDVDFNLKDSAGVKQDSVRVEQWNVHLVGLMKMPIGDYFNFFAKGGLAYINVDQKYKYNIETGTVTKHTDSLDTVAFTGGVGMEVAWDQFGIRGEYTVIRPNETAQDDFYISDLIGLNAYYKFM